MEPCGEGIPGVRTKKTVVWSHSKCAKCEVWSTPLDNAELSEETLAWDVLGDVVSCTDSDEVSKSSLWGECSRALSRHGVDRLYGEVVEVPNTLTGMAKLYAKCGPDKSWVKSV